MDLKEDGGNEAVFLSKGQATFFEKSATNREAHEVRPKAA